MKYVWSVLALSLVLPSLSLGQVGADNHISTKVYKKIIRTDLMYNILPLLLTRPQVKQLLPVLIKARDEVRATQAREDKLMADLEILADKAYHTALEKQILPDEPTRAKFAAAIQAIRIGREQTNSINTEAVHKEFVKIVNKGQLKTAAGSLNVKFFRPDLKPEEVTPELKEKLYVRYILLDDDTFQILTDLLAAMKD